MNYPDAERYIPATPELRTNWIGPLEYLDLDEDDSEEWLPAMYYGNPCGTFGILCGEDRSAEWGVENAEAVAIMRFDPDRPEVRDHLIRRLNLPAWMRDAPGGIEPWIAAGLVACAAAGVELVALENEPEVVASIKRGMDLGIFDMGLAAVLLDSDTLLLPFPNGPRIWRRA